MWSVQKAIYWGGALLLCLVSILLYFPGSMGNDSLSQWYQVNGILAVNDWHPPIIVHLWSMFNVVLKGPAGLLIFQHILYWSGLALLIDAMVSGRTNSLKLAVLAVIGLFPIVWFSLASVWKDGLMISALIFAVGLYAFARNHKFANQFFKAGVAISIWLALVLACGFRHNALLAVLPLVFMMVYDFFPNFGQLKKIALGAALFFSIFFLSRACNQFGVDQHYPYLVNQLVFWNLAGLSIEADEMLVPTEAFIQKDSAKVDVLKRYYNDASNNNLVFSSGIINTKIWEDELVGKRFLNAGLNIIAEHPTEYVKMRLRFLKHFSGLGRWMPYAAFIFETKYWEGDETLGLPTYHMRNPVALKFLEENIASRLSRFGFFNVIPYLLFLVLVSLLLVFQIVRGIERPRSKLYLGLALSGLLYWLPYIVISPSNDFRYHLWTIQVAMVILIVGGVNILYNRLKLEEQ